MTFLLNQKKKKRTQLLNMDSELKELSLLDHKNGTFIKMHLPITLHTCVCLLNKVGFKKKEATTLFGHADVYDILSRGERQTYAETQFIQISACVCRWSSLPEDGFTFHLCSCFNVRCTTIVFERQ